VAQRLACDRRARRGKAADAAGVGGNRVVVQLDHDLERRAARPAQQRPVRLGQPAGRRLVGLQPRRDGKRLSAESGMSRSSACVDSEE
jgi:hypothetical protein